MLKARTFRVASSGSKKIDQLFVKIVNALNKQVAAIYKLRRLRDPSDRRSILRGLAVPIGVYKKRDIYEVYVSAQHSDRDDQGMTIIHEALHIIYPHKKHLFIYRWEDIVWRRLSSDQKRIIKYYIPKHFVKTEP